MSKTSSRFTLADWRKTVGELYAQIRACKEQARDETCDRFREARDALFRHHPDTPLSGDRLNAFHGIEYFPYHPKWRVMGRVQAANGDGFEIPLARDGVLRVSPAGRAHFELEGRAYMLTVFWMEGYGGGLWLPFGDATGKKDTFGGGRYLYDTIKGADLGVNGDTMVLDFNYAYNPSCAYNDHWVCPLVPRENVLPIAIEAGEKVFR
ncbi:MAG: DUF1684 domain-containing protein [Gammaproteobacteria bacterium]|nr:DUF1684 domain-containing protein [Gammaproteobacteria bacterium]MDH3411797.1 DUF1684 domain-containing protein [Gammaproteobacteria bacterium]